MFQTLSADALDVWRNCEQHNNPDDAPSLSSGLFTVALGLPLFVFLIRTSQPIFTPTVIIDVTSSDLYSWRNYERHIPAMLQNGHSVLIYAGEEDFLCNWLGNKVGIEVVKWHHRGEH